MPIKYKRNCNQCGEYYEKWGKYYCSVECSKLSEEWREKQQKAKIGKRMSPATEFKRKLEETSYSGYIYIWEPSHPYPEKYKRMKRATLVAEKCLNRFLTKEEIIHHIDNNRKNDKPSNLYVFGSDYKHKSFHGLKIKPILTSNLPTIDELILPENLRC